MAFETISLGTHPAGTGGDTARTAFEKVNRNFIAADVLDAAMPQAQFDANRNANKELYAASGWVIFGNHESGKQVNECKPGLYTALTTPNTLLIGKAGGVGGSKTDYASVHIDGVVFNLTNQFVLTLPSHPTSALPERMDMYGVEAEKVEISAASPNAYQGGLRGVGAAVNLFSATDQQKKDFFTQNSNTTFIGSDGKIYQWQVYKIAFAGSTDGLPSPTEQGYSLNSFGDLWLKAGKNLLYFGNVLRLNDGGYHPSHNPLGAAKFVGDTFWYNTTASITSRSDCFNPAKLLAGSGSIASGKSGRPEIGGRYYDAVYTDGYGGVCRDMRYSAKDLSISDYEITEKNSKNGKYRGFEKLSYTNLINGSNDSEVSTFGVYYHDTFPSEGKIYISVLSGVNSNIEIGSKQHIYRNTDGLVLSGIVTEVTAFGITLSRIGDDIPEWRTYSVQSTLGYIWCFEYKKNLIVGGSCLNIDVVGSIPIIKLTTGLSGGWLGGIVHVNFDYTYKKYEYTRKVYYGVGFPLYTLDNGGSWNVSGTQVTPKVDNSRDGSEPAGIVILFPYGFITKITEPSSVRESLFGEPNYLFSSSSYLIDNGSLLGESLIGKVLKNNSGVSVNNKSLLSCAIDSTGKLTSAANFDGVTHSQLTLGAPANNSPAFKVVSYLANINQKAVPHYAYTELKHNGTNWGDDGKQAIVDNQSTKTDLNGNTVLVGTAKLKEPIGWIKNKV